MSIDSKEVVEQMNRETLMATWAQVEGVWLAPAETAKEEGAIIKGEPPLEHERFEFEKYKFEQEMTEEKWRLEQEAQKAALSASTLQHSCAACD